MLENVFGDFRIFCYLTLVLIVAHCKSLSPSDSKLVMLFTLSRHGDRAPIHKLPSDPYQNHWTSGYAQLTVSGAAQLTELGQFVRNRYSSFIPQTYHKVQYPNFHIFISSGTHRTLMSANSFLRGLFKLELQQNASIPPPVFTLSSDDDHLLKMSRNCPEYRERLHKLTNSDQVAKKISLFSETITRLETVFRKLSNCWICEIHMKLIWKLFTGIPMTFAHRLVINSSSGIEQTRLMTVSSCRSSLKFFFRRLAKNK
ncbi:unnamed protein product [Echinostoma caproni]|uniref:acid phosphatase n=1 Tax=Echinostoma caproni TaxID=27848 RepID=A0A183B8Z0_9TREM|nr:unnamed protein product [Echinostoma caproni]